MLIILLHAFLHVCMRHAARRRSIWKISSINHCDIHERIVFRRGNTHFGLEVTSDMIPRLSFFSSVPLFYLETFHCIVCQGFSVAVFFVNDVCGGAYHNQYNQRGVHVPFDDRKDHRKIDGKSHDGIQLGHQRLLLRRKELRCVRLGDKFL